MEIGDCRVGATADQPTADQERALRALHNEIPKYLPNVRKLAIITSSMLLAVLAAGCGGSRSVVRTVTVERKATVVSSATGDQRLYGQIKSLRRRGDHYELRFDPAWFLSGLTANVAQAEDKGAPCRPSDCPPVANDNYVVDEGHRVLTYIVPTHVRGSVLAKNSANAGPFPSTTIAASTLAQLVVGKSSLKLFEPLSSGVWILVHGDTVRTFAQQYVP
jgi:hypothetical protein